jgi:hypothetical protein
MRPSSPPRGSLLPGRGGSPTAPRVAGTQSSLLRSTRPPRGGSRQSQSSSSVWPSFSDEVEAHWDSWIRWWGRPSRRRPELPPPRGWPPSSPHLLLCSARIHAASSPTPRQSSSPCFSAPLGQPHARPPPRVAHPTHLSFDFEERGSVFLPLLCPRNAICLRFCMSCWRRNHEGTLARVKNAFGSRCWTQTWIRALLGVTY